MNNPGRQVEIDIAKGIAIIGMVFVHAEEYFYNESIPWVVQVIEFFGSPPAAPVFMMALGVGIVYSKNNSPAQLAKRGIKMLGLSYLYNFLVYALPHLIVYFKDGDAEQLPTAIEEFANVDILQFASLAFLTFALIKKINIKTKPLIVSTLLVVAVGEWITDHVIFPEGFIRYALGLIFGTSEISYFPYCSWIGFPVAGYIFGQKLSQCYEKKAFYKTLFKIFMPIYFVLLFNSLEMVIDFGQVKGDYQLSYYHMGLYGNICLISFALWWVGMCYYLSKKMSKWFVDYLKKLSTNITVIYVVQYAIIVYSYVFIAKETSVLDIADAMFVSVAVFFASVRISDKYVEMKKAKALKAQKKKIKEEK